MQPERLLPLLQQLAALLILSQIIPVHSLILFLSLFLQL
jgi:hypothetical protein